MNNSKIQSGKFTLANLKLSFSKIRNPQSAIRNHSVRNHSSCPPGETAFSDEDIMAARLRVTKVLPFQQASPPFINNLWLAVVSGVLLVLAFPNWNLWSLGWVGTAPLIMALAREQKFWRSFALGLTTGTIFYAGSSPWITYSMHNYGGIPLWLCYLLLVVIAMILGSFTALFAGVLGYAVKSFGGWAILSAPVLWAASEWLRLQLTGLGWNNLGYSQAFQPTLIQTARLGGVYLVSAFLVSMSTAIVFSLIYLGYRRGWVVFSIAVLLAIATLWYGLRGVHSYGSFPVAIIQPNIPIDGNWGDKNFEQQMLLRHFKLSEEAFQEEAARSHPLPVQLLIWPESPMDFHYESDAQLRQTLSAFVQKHHVYLLINSWGAPKASDAADRNYNSALLISPSGELISRYDKIALMPFGEYVPARGFIPFMDKIPTLVADVLPGKNFTLQEVGDARLGTLICFDVTRPEIARRFKNEGATTLVQLSNESWFGPTAAARQVLAQAVFRAVENNTDLIRVTNSGLSGQVTGEGEIVYEAPMFETATGVFATDKIQEARSRTFYTRYGDGFAIACASLSALLAVAAIIFARLKKKEDDEE
ncbi:MAG: apolipoprotein N-acyltransferase [Acidobacteria bacterium]|nr:apolipoprotein N-acyltransferase [Acidobacteriota bacterium]